MSSAGHGRLDYAGITTGVPQIADELLQRPSRQRRAITGLLHGSKTHYSITSPARPRNGAPEQHVRFDKRNQLFSESPIRRRAQRNVTGEYRCRPEACPDRSPAIGTGGGSREEYLPSSSACSPCFARH